MPPGPERAGAALRRIADARKSWRQRPDPRASAESGTDGAPVPPDASVRGNRRENGVSTHPAGTGGMSRSFLSSDGMPYRRAEMRCGKNGQGRPVRAAAGRDARSGAGTMRLQRFQGRVLADPGPTDGPVSAVCGMRAACRVGPTALVGDMTGEGMAGMKRRELFEGFRGNSVKFRQGGGRSNRAFSDGRRRLRVVGRQEASVGVALKRATSVDVA